MEAEDAALRAYYERGMERLGDGRGDLEFTRTTEIVLRRLPAAPGAGLADDPGLKASQHSTGGALSVFETMVEAGPPLHVHDREDECFYVLEGELSIRCGSDVFDALAGSFVFLPRGRAHRFWARDQSARLLMIAVPGGIEDYFGQINNASDDVERHRIGELYGIRVVPE